MSKTTDAYLVWLEEQELKIKEENNEKDTTVAEQCDQ